MSDEDKLAEEWAAALEEVDEKAEGGDAGDGGGDSDSSEEDDMAAAWAASLASEEEQSEKAKQEQKALHAQSKEFQYEDLTEAAKAAPPAGYKRELDFILDIPLVVSAQLGSTRLLINELLQLGQGSVVELEKLAGEPLEILVNGKLIARGEAVVVNEKFGVRLTDIISPIERVKYLT